VGAAEKWRRALADWAIPEEILANAPEPPWSFSPEMFARRAEQLLARPTDSPSRRRAIEAIPDRGSVLDVGVGGGAGCLPLVPPAALLIGVDQGRGMLDAFAAAADRLGVAHREVCGNWPDAAAEVGPVDVVVSHHVLYNVGDLAPFVGALTTHARNRVVVEISGDHPTSNLNPLWSAIHGIVRPTSPAAEDAVAVLAEMGVDVQYEEFERPWQGMGGSRADMVASMRRRLCVGPERDAEIDALLAADEEMPPRRNMTIWWDGTA
jgi:hypothetical protein